MLVLLFIGLNFHFNNIYHHKRSNKELNIDRVCIEYTSLSYEAPPPRPYASLLNFSWKQDLLLYYSTDPIILSTNNFYIKPWTFTHHGFVVIRLLDVYHCNEVARWVVVLNVSNRWFKIVNNITILVTLVFGILKTIRVFRTLKQLLVLWTINMSRRINDHKIMYSQHTKSEETRLPSSVSLNFIASGTQVSSQFSLGLWALHLTKKQPNIGLQKRP